MYVCVHMFVCCSLYVFNILTLITCFLVTDEGGECWKYNLRVSNIMITNFMLFHIFFNIFSKFMKLFTDICFVFQPCTESLFLALFHEFRCILSPLLVDLICKNHAPVDPNNLQAILAKDAVYNAVGLAAFDMYDEVKLQNTDICDHTDIDHFYDTTEVEL